MKLSSMIAMLTAILSLGATGSPAHAGASDVASERRILLVAAQTHHGEGTVMAVNSKDRKIQLAHGPIESLYWGAMKMFFGVEDTDLLDEVEVGDQVDFEFIKTNDGRFLITDIEPKE